MTLLKTYDRVAPMGGLAVMAQQRVWNFRWDTPPLRRCGCPHCERYFEIIDRITRGEQP